jgi:hypothetical protein
MLQKFKITTCAFILCLFGIPLTTEAQVMTTSKDINMRIHTVDCKNMTEQDTQYFKKMAMVDTSEAVENACVTFQELMQQQMQYDKRGLGVIPHKEIPRVGDGMAPPPNLGDSVLNFRDEGSTQNKKSVGYCTGYCVQEESE